MGIKNFLVQAKHDLIRKFEKKEMEEKDYTSQLDELQDKIDTNTESVIEAKQKEQEEKNKMTEEQKQKAPVESKPIGRKKQKDSIASAIAEVLAKKSIKNIDDAVAKVIEAKPEAVPKRVKAQISLIIKETEKGKGRWKNYTWDKDNFLLTEKA